MKLFLSSNWKNSFIMTWAIEPELLIEHVPHKIGIYTQNDKAYISLFVYNYENTKVRGIKMPFHVSFTELDLRFYVKHNNQMGVSFIQHIVPRYCISLWAKRIFNENYVTLPIEYSYQETTTSKILHYKFWKNKTPFTLDLLTNHEFDTLDFNLINEVAFGMGMDKYGNPIRFNFSKLHEYQSYTNLDYSINIDFGFLFGRKWGFLKELSPIHVAALTDNKIKIFQPTFVYERDSNLPTLENESKEKDWVNTN